MAKGIESYHNNMKFTSIDADNDYSGGNCSNYNLSQGPGWFNDCYIFHPFNNPKRYRGIVFILDYTNG